MIRNVSLVLLVLFSILSSSVFNYSASLIFAQEVVSEDASKEDKTKCTALEALKRTYGNIMAMEEEKGIKLTFSVPYTEINAMLTLVVGNNWYPKHLSICGAGSEKAAISMVISREENDAFRRFKVLQKLCLPGALPWKDGKLDNKQAYVTSIETDFGKDFCIIGETLKSGLIFTTLTPRITSIGADLENLDSERFSSKKNFDRKKMFTRETYEDNDTGINGQPFFERGTYYYSDNDRYMVFTLRCQW